MAEVSEISDRGSDQIEQKVAPRFELGMGALQAPALPLGHATYSFRLWVGTFSDKVLQWRSMGFVWGYIYIGLGLLNCALSGWSAFWAFKEGQTTEGVGITIGVLIILTSLYGLLRRRRWGLILTSILLGLMMVIAAWQVWQIIRQMPQVPGFLPTVLLMSVASFFYGLFFFVYFLRRRKLFT